ncbi:hypothetical protein ROS217_07814 [Roseovarius sp. 217]|nr:hypothetical protein ROS217_07814 [Roseovarius sp. 217]
MAKRQDHLQHWAWKVGTVHTTFSLMFFRMVALNNSFAIL